MSRTLRSSTLRRSSTCLLTLACVSLLLAGATSQLYGPEHYALPWVRVIGAGSVSASEADGSGWMLVGGIGVGDGVVSESPIGYSIVEVPYDPTEIAIGDEGEAADDQPTLVLLTPFPGIAGFANSFSVIGAAPGAEVHFIYAAARGSTPIRACPGLAVDLANPTRFAAAIADGSGVASVPLFVAGPAHGATIWLQAVDPVNCLVSQPIVHTFR
ncbi:MAG: hypothetical protein KJZ69_18665 [Phycisphaerales bacterium]|nr:hypothetical protein [Phycisphaerales bacterium]